MLKKFSVYYLLVLVLWAGSSCKTSYQRISKSSDLDLKMSKGKEYFEKKEYAKAIPLLEELITIYKGSRNIDDLYWMYAKSHFEQADYLIASFHFKNIYDSYPNSKYAEESLYLNAVCYQRLSPQPNLDQEYTSKAIQYYQLFVNAYPNSEKVADCNSGIKILRRKLETKAFNSAELYYNIGQYKAAATAFKNLMKDFPDSQDSEKAGLLTIKSYYLYARNSILEKQAERFEMTINAYKEFLIDYPNGKYLKEAEEINANAKKNLEKINTNSYGTEKK
jgi:outer membrane protein assembly factor BamD